MSKSKGWVKIIDATLVDWDKQKSKPIEGKLLPVITARSKKGDKAEYKIYKVETSTGIVSFTGSQLEQKLKDIKPKTEVKIVYTGKAKTSKGFKVNTFDVFTR